MPYQHIQNIFSAGELDPLLRARTDKEFYGGGARTMLNFLPAPQGGVTRRPGTRFLGNAMSESGRLIPFVFSASQGRILEFGNQKMRVWMPDGSYVVSGSSPYEVATPYPLSALRDLRFAQSADVIYFAHPNYAPRKLSRYADNDWRWTTPTFVPGIAAPRITGVTMQGSTESTVSNRQYRYVVTAVDSDSGQESAKSNEGSVWAKLLTTNYFPRITWNAVSGAAYYNVYKFSGGVFGFIGRAQGTTFDDTNIAADTEDSPLTYKNPFSGSGNYPSHVFFFQQRLGYASTTNNPLRFWLSRTGEFESFAAAVPPADDDSIEVTLAAQQAAQIAWCRPDRSCLAFGTESSEWILQPSQGSVLTPKNCSFQPQGSVGSEKLEAVGMTEGMVYLQRASKAVRAFSYQYSADKYVAQDLTLMARHLLKDVSITAWAYQQEPYSILWCVTSDGGMLGLTVMQEQGVAGWHRHTTDGTVKDVASIPGTPDDQVWLLVKRGSTAMIERLETFFRSDDLADAFFLDSAMTYDGQGASSFNGLTHLAGRDVMVFADGGTIAGLKVTSQGTLTLPRTVKHAVIGLPYTSTLIPNMAEVMNNQVNSLMHDRTILHARFRVLTSMTFEAGVDALHPVVDRMSIHGERTTFPIEPFYDEATDLDCVIGSGWKSDYPLTVQVSTPTPLTLLAILLAMDVAQYSGRAR